MKKRHRAYGGIPAVRMLSILAALAILLSFFAISGPAGLKAYAAGEDTEWYDRSDAVPEEDVYDGLPELSAAAGEFDRLPYDDIDEQPDFYVPSSSVRSDYDLFEYVITDKGAVITKCGNSAAGAVYIPGSLGGAPVVAIGNESFKGCRGITEIILPDTVTSIGHYAFYGCTSLTKINITDKIGIIGHGAFDGCGEVCSIGKSGDVIVYGGSNRVYDNSGDTAQPNAPTPNGLSITDAQLAEIMAVLRTYPEMVNVYKYDIPVSDVGKLECALAKKYPYDIYATIYNWGYSRMGSTLYGLYPFYCADSMDKATADKYIANLKAAVKPYLEQVSGKDQFTCAALAHNYVILRADYDYDYNYYGAYDILVRRSAVCQGYSEAFDLLMKLKDIPCYIVSSEPMNHAWNMVKINDYWFHVDNTWDDMGEDTRNTIVYAHFLRTDTEIKNLQHNDWYIFPDITYTAAPTCASKNYSSMPRETGQDIMDGRWYYYDVDNKNIVSTTFTGSGKKTVRAINNNICCGVVGYQGVIVFSDGKKIFMRDPLTGKEKGIYTTTESENNGYVASLNVDNSGNLKYTYSDSYTVYDSNFFDYFYFHYIFFPDQEAGLFNTKLTNATYLLNIAFPQTSTTVTVGKSQKLAIKRYPYTSQAALTWSSSNSSIATVDANGSVTGKAVGIVTITAKYSNLSASTKVVVAPVMEAPGSFSGVITSTDSIKLTWTASKNANGYEIMRSTAKNGTYTSVAFTNKLIYRETGLTPGKTYYYKVRPYAVVSGNKAFGPFTSAKALKPIPLTPKGVKARSLGYKTLKITWKEVKNVSGYQISRSTSASGTFSAIATVSSSNLYYKDTSVTCGKKYYYKVRAYKVVNSNKVFGKYSSVVNAKPVPSTPSPKAKVASSTSIKVSWSKTPGANGYQVYRSTAKDGQYKLLGTITSTSYTDKSLKAGKTYYYKVRAYRTVNSKRVYGDYGTTQCTL